MRKLFLRLCVFMVLMFVVDRAYGLLMSHLFDTTQGGTTAKSRFVADSVRTDVLIFGSSRGRMAYDPQILTDSLGMTCYNCGSNGMGIIYHYGMMKLVTERYMPRMVMIDILPIIDIMQRDDNISFANELRHWYHRAGVDSIFWKIDPNERYKMASKMYQYHAKFLEVFSSRNTVKTKEVFVLRGTRNMKTELYDRNSAHIYGD